MEKKKKKGEGEFIDDYSSFFMDKTLERFAEKMKEEGKSIESKDPNVIKEKKKAHKKKKKKEETYYE